MTNEELVKAIQEGENVKDNLEVLYLQNRGIIEKIVNRFKGCHDPEDLRQEAFFGIANAARSWSRGTGAPFINYAVFHVRRVIVDYIRRDQFSISDHVIKDLMRYRKAVQAYREQYSRDPSEDELRELKQRAELSEDDCARFDRIVRILQGVHRSIRECAEGLDEFLFENIAHAVPTTKLIDAGMPVNHAEFSRIRTHFYYDLSRRL